MADRVVVNMGREGAEEQAAVDAAVPVDSLENLQQMDLIRVRGQQELAYRYACLAAAAESPALVGKVLRPLPQPNDGQGWGDAVFTQPRRP